MRLSEERASVWAMGHPDDAFQGALRQVADVLMYTFDFEPLASVQRTAGISVPGADCRVFACDATGGQYVSCQLPGEQYVLHVEDRGVYRVLATSVPRALRMIVELPYFRELLAEAAHGGLSRMRVTARRLEQEVLDDIGALPEARAFIVRELELPELDDPVQELYRLGLASPISVSSEDGFEYRSELRPPARRTA